MHLQVGTAQDGLVNGIAGIMFNNIYILLFMWWKGITFI
jgi:hypothetical protein